MVSNVIERVMKIASVQRMFCGFYRKSKSFEEIFTQESLVDFLSFLSLPRCTRVTLTLLCWFLTFATLVEGIIIHFLLHAKGENA